MKGSNKRVVLIVGASFTNKGAEAMLLIVADAVRKCLPGVEILAQIPSMDFEKAEANGLLPIESDRPKSIVSRILSKVRASRTRYKAGAVIDIGGYQFGDPWGEKHAWRKATAVKHWFRSGIPVFFLPQAWGPFSSTSRCNAIRTIINTATLSFARDKTSLAEVQRLVGKDNPKVRFAHDVAWNFRGDDLSAGRQLVREAGLLLKANTMTVCLTPNLKVYRKFEGTGAKNEYIGALTHIVEHLCRVHNAQVILVGHVILEDNSEKKDDRTLCNYILSSLDRSLPVIHLDKVLSAAQIKSVIGNSDLLLSSRYHALIAGLSQGIPAATIGWSHKYDELMREVNLSSNVISLPKANKEILKEIDAIVGQIAYMREAIASIVPVMKQSGQEALDEVILKIKERF
jgi:colanic acid/amylovoran biosynthesis protein